MEFERWLALAVRCRGRLLQQQEEGLLLYQKLAAQCVQHALRQRKWMRPLNCERYQAGFQRGCYGCRCRDQQRDIQR